MVIKEEILTMMLEEYGGWASSAEDFRSFIKLTAKLAETDAAMASPEMPPNPSFENELGDIFIKVFGVFIAPYKNYADLKRHCSLKEDTWERFNLIASKIEEDYAISDLSEDSGSGRKTIKNEIIKNQSVKFLINHLRPYIDFK